jgi:hypothetical protein
MRLSDAARLSVVVYGSTETETGSACQSYLALTDKNTAEMNANPYR